MRPTSVPRSAPESHTITLSGGAPRGGLRALVSPQTLTGGLTELAWVSAHALLYPLGTRTEQLRPDGRYRPGVQSPAVRAAKSINPGPTPASSQSTGQIRGRPPGASPPSPASPTRMLDA